MGMSMKCRARSTPPPRRALLDLLARQPEARPPRMMFSRPDRLWLKPTPRATERCALPRTSIEPLVGGRIPAIARISVDLPAPFEPMIPIALPLATSKETFLIASTSLTARWPRPIVRGLLECGLALEGGAVGDGGFCT